MNPPSSCPFLISTFAPLWSPSYCLTFCIFIFFTQQEVMFQNSKWFMWLRCLLVHCHFEVWKFCLVGWINYENHFWNQDKHLGFLHEAYRHLLIKNILGYLALNNQTDKWGNKEMMILILHVQMVSLWSRAQGFARHNWLCLSTGQLFPELYLKVIFMFIFFLIMHVCEHCCILSNSRDYQHFVNFCV